MDHYSDVIMRAMVSQITSVSVVYSTVFFQAQIKENSKAPRRQPLWGEVTGEFRAQRASNAENVSIWWRRHAKSAGAKHNKTQQSMNSVWKFGPYYCTFEDLYKSLDVLSYLTVMWSVRGDAVHWFGNEITMIITVSPNYEMSILA